MSVFSLTETEFELLNFCNKRLLLMLTTLSLAACVVLPSSRDEILQDWKLRVNSARELCRQEKYKQAAAQYSESLLLLCKAPDSSVFQALTQRELGILHLVCKEQAKALEAFKKSKNLFSMEKSKDPDTYSLYTEKHVDVLCRLAELEKKQEKKADALADYKQALNLELDNEHRDKLRLEILNLEERLGLHKSSGYGPEIMHEVMQIGNADNRFTAVPVILESARLRQKNNCSKSVQILLALIDLCKEKHDSSAEAQAMLQLSLTYYQMGELKLAELVLKQAIADCGRREPFMSYHAAFLAGLSFVERRQNLDSAALAHLNQSFQLAGQVSSRRTLVAELESLAQIDESGGRSRLAAEALAYAGKAISELPASGQELKTLEQARRRVLTSAAKKHDSAKSK